jgi:ribosome-associated toxin RatA of RatAB toxin-antitoxin module
MTPPADPVKANARSPFAGCAILIAALLVMIFLIVFSTKVLFSQYEEIQRFTAEKPVPVEVTPIENRETDLNPLAEKIEAFRSALTTDAETQLTLTPEEINLAIAAYEPFKDLRGTFRITSIEGETLRIAISFPLNGKPRRTRDGEPGWVTSDPRYLNATLIAKPALLQREVVLQIDKIEVPNSTVPKEFTELMSPYRITERYLTHPTIGPAMARITSVEIKDGTLILRRKPGQIPADLITDETVDSSAKRLFTFFAIAASCFLVFVAIVLFIGLRAKARRP